MASRLSWFRTIQALNYSTPVKPSQGLIALVVIKPSITRLENFKPSILGLRPTLASPACCIFTHGIGACRRCQFQGQGQSHSSWDFEGPSGRSTLGSPGVQWVDPNELFIDVSCIARHRQLRRMTKDSLVSPAIDLNDKKVVREKRRERLQTLAQARTATLRKSSTF